MATSIEEEIFAQLNAVRQCVLELLSMPEEEMWALFASGEIDRWDTNFKSQVIVSLVLSARMAMSEGEALNRVDA
ncbi:MAG: hypothetical protein HGA78_09585 [Nitrospirales bacterium]|nr:hypothetical protein [Nitrospirales bacterium]